MKKLKHVILVASILMGISLNAQTTVKIIDFSVLPLSGPTTDSVTLSVRFKVNEPSKATNAVVWLGTARDSSNVFTAQPVFNTTTGGTTITYNGISQTVHVYEILFYITLSTVQYNNYRAATLFVQTGSGPTTRLYFNK